VRANAIEKYQKNGVAQFMTVVANEHPVFIGIFSTGICENMYGLFSANFDRKFEQISAGHYQIA